MFSLTHTFFGSIDGKAPDQVRRRFSRRFQISMVGEGVLVGLAAGAVVTFYRASLSQAGILVRKICAFAAASPLTIAAWFLVLVALAALVSLLVKLVPDTNGSGIPQIDAEVIGKLDAPWQRVLPAKFIEGTLCALAGLSLGREGPSVQLGGMAGKAISKMLKARRGEERLLVTCGAAAGMSAAFNAPLTGVLFAVEEIHKAFSAPLIISVMAASVASDFLVSQILGVHPVLHFYFPANLPHSYYAYLMVFGIVCGLAGALHNHGMFYMSRLYEKIHVGTPFLRYVIPFILSGIVAFSYPIFLNGGDSIVEFIKEPQSIPLITLLGLLVGKYIFTTLCFGSGAPGGTLFPLVVMGALIGALYGVSLLDTFNIPAHFVTNFVILGIAGLFASVVRAPVTAIVLAFELTGSLDALLSVSIISILSYVVANITKVEPFYEHLLAKLILNLPKKIAKNRRVHQKYLADFTIGAGSSVEGKSLKEIDWPGTSRIVVINRSGEDIVPTGDTVLEALDEVLVIMEESEVAELQPKLGDMMHCAIGDVHISQTSRLFNYVQRHTRHSRYKDRKGGIRHADIHSGDSDKR